MRDHFLSMRQLPVSSGTAQGLFDYLTGALNSMGVTEWEKGMIRFGCDGCSANVGESGGLKSLLQQDFPCTLCRNLICVYNLKLSNVSNFGCLVKFMMCPDKIVFHWTLVHLCLDTIIKLF